MIEHRFSHLHFFFFGSSFLPSNVFSFVSAAGRGEVGAGLVPSGKLPPGTYSQTPVNPLVLIPSSDTCWAMLSVASSRAEKHEAKVTVGLLLPPLQIARFNR